MKSLDDASVCPNSQNDDQCATSSPHSNCPDDRSNFRKLVRRKSDTLKEIIIVPLETNVNAVIPLPRIIEVQEQKKLPQFTRKKEFRRNIDNNIAVPSSSNDNGNVAERNNQAIPSKSGKNLRNKLSSISKTMNSLTNHHFAPKRYAFIPFQFKIEMTDLREPKMKETKILLA